VLESQLRAEPLAMDQRRKAGMRPDFRFAVDRQQLAVAPQVVRPGLDFRAGHGGADLRVVVVDFQWSEACLADMQRSDRILLSAFLALEIGDVAHRSPLLMNGGGLAPRAASTSGSRRNFGYSETPWNCRIVGQHSPRQPGHRT